MTTINLATALENEGTTTPVPVKAGMYMWGATSSNDSTVRAQLSIHIGDVGPVPMSESFIDLYSSQIVFLPDCTVSVSVLTERGSTANVALVRFGDVVGHVTETETFDGPIFDEPIG